MRVDDKNRLSCWWGILLKGKGKCQIRIAKFLLLRLAYIMVTTIFICLSPAPCYYKHSSHLLLIFPLKYPFYSFPNHTFILSFYQHIIYEISKEKIAVTPRDPKLDFHLPPSLKSSHMH